MRRFAYRTWLFVLPFAVACTAASVSNPTQGKGTGGLDGDQAGDGATPPQETTVVTPTTSLQVSVALASVRLGDEKCTHDESLDVKTQSCAALTDASPVGTGMCGGPCKFTNMQLSFTSGKTGSPSHVTIIGASLFDASTAKEVAALTAYTPLVWDGAKYVAWDENVAPGAAVKTSYTLSPPEWSTLGGSYATQYKLRVYLTIDGVALTLESEALSRDPPVAT